MWLVLTDWVSDQLILMQFSWVFWFILFVCLLGNHISMMLQVRVHGRFDLLQTKPYPWKYTGMCMRFSSLSLSLTLACRSGVFVKFMQYFFKVASRFLEQNPSDLIEIYADSWILPHLYQANCVLSSCALKAYIFHLCIWKLLLEICSLLFCLKLVINACSGATEGSEQFRVYCSLFLFKLLHIYILLMFASLMWFRETQNFLFFIFFGLNCFFSGKLYFKIRN